MKNPKWTILRPVEHIVLEENYLGLQAATLARHLRCGAPENRIEWQCAMSVWRRHVGTSRFPYCDKSLKVVGDAIN